MTTATMPSADIVFDTLFAYQRSGALKSAIELDMFTIIDTGTKTAAAIASKCDASERGIRILCDYLTTIGLLTKSDGTYRLTPESAAFLSKNSRAYLGTTMKFLLLPELKTEHGRADRSGSPRRRAAGRRQYRRRGESDLDRVRAFDGTDDDAGRARDR